MSFVSVIFEFMGTNEFTIPGYDLSFFSFGLFDYNLVRGFSLAWFIIVMISRSNRLSYSTGLIFENLESKMGKWVNFCTAAVGLLSFIDKHIDYILFYSFSFLFHRYYPSSGLFFGSMVCVGN